MAVHFDNVTMPTSMANKGALDFPPPEVIGYDGEGQPITAPARAAVWTWQQLATTEADWLLQTFLAGAAYRRCDDGLRIYDPLNERAETNFSYAVVDRPTWDKVTNGVYYVVKLTIRDILA